MHARKITGVFLLLRGSEDYKAYESTVLFKINFSKKYN